VAGYTGRFPFSIAEPGRDIPSGLREGSMRRRLLFGFTLFFALAAILALPWLALREAKRQAYDTAAELTLGYARDVLHRADSMAMQSQEAIARLKNAGHLPCSPPEIELMRQLDLSSTYIQAVGHVRDGVMLCSSMGRIEFNLGKETFRTLNRVAVYLDVPIGEPGKTPLMALVRDQYAVLVHRDLPLDTWTSIPGVSLSVFQLDRPMDSAPELAHGNASRAWLSHLGASKETAFTDANYLVAIARSGRFRIAAVAAVPIAYLRVRSNAIALRLVPVGAIAGLAVAIAILLLARQQRSLAAALRHALRRHEFFMQYQPIIELDSGRCVGVEALLRWRTSSGELIGPDLFIPVAEQSGLITRLTERVLQLVEADAGLYLSTHPDFHVALNLSAADLRSTAIVDLLDHFVAKSGARPSNLVIEITERGFLDVDLARRVIAALRTRGHEVAVDDFGTGYSSLSYVESLDLDFLKIDRSFVEAIGTKGPTSQVVGHIIAMARSMGLRMIAEGVERPEQADFLKAQDVQYAQGWLFGKPMPFDEVVRKREAHREENSTHHANAA
jgi:sensor c-di-GMP phosphodiesterase-like protein